jgi:hypothetical protein
MVLLVFFRIPDHYKLVAKRENIISRLTNRVTQSVNLDDDKNHHQKDSVEKLIKMHLNDDGDDNTSISSANGKIKKMTTLQNDPSKS